MAEATTVELISPGRGGPVEQSWTLLSAVADPVRWTVLSHLAERGTSCVCDLQERVPVAANLLSYHLKVLRDAELVTTSRRGRWIDYSLADGVSRRLAEALPVGGAATSR
jgi:ArsR family transcriptional regulator